MFVYIHTKRNTQRESEGRLISTIFIYAHTKRAAWNRENWIRNSCKRDLFDFEIWFPFSLLNARCASVSSETCRRAKRRCRMADDDGIIKLRIRFGGISNSSLLFFSLCTLCGIFQFLREPTQHRHRVKIKAKSFFSYKSIKMMNGFPPQRNATRVAAGALTSSNFPTRAENFCHKKITVYECSQRVEIVEVESLQWLRKIPCRSLNHVEYKVEAVALRQRGGQTGSMTSIVRRVGNSILSLSTT